MENLISVIIPVYNVEKYLKRCLDSVINQTYKSLEIILVDDGSTDKSGKICDEYSAKDNRIKTLHKNNGGPGYARNTGLDIAKGDYIGFVDADDYLDKEMFSLMISEQKKFDADIVCCNIALVYSNKKIRNFNPTISNGFVDKDLAMKLAIKEMWFGAFLCNKLFRREMFNNFKLKENIFYEDYDAGTRLIIKAKKIVYIKNSLYFYFQGNADSTTHQYTYSKILDYFNVAVDVVNVCKENSLNKSLYYAKKTLVEISLSLIRKIYIDKIEKRQNLIVNKVKTVLVDNLQIFLFYNIPIKKKIFGIAFIVYPYIIKHLRRFL